VSGHGIACRGGMATMASVVGVISSHDMVAAGVVRAPISCLLGEGGQSSLPRTKSCGTH
jgi:hypothetical protein